MEIAIAWIASPPGTALIASITTIFSAKGYINNQRDRKKRMKILEEIKKNHQELNNPNINDYLLQQICRREARLAAEKIKRFWKKYWIDLSNDDKKKKQTPRKKRDELKKKIEITLGIDWTLTSENGGKLIYHNEKTRKNLKIKRKDKPNKSTRQQNPVAKKIENVVNGIMKIVKRKDTPEKANSMETHPDPEDYQQICDEVEHIHPDIDFDIELKAKELQHKWEVIIQRAYIRHIKEIPSAIIIQKNFRGFHIRQQNYKVKERAYAANAGEYNGWIINHKRNGQGKMTYTDGGVYEGDFQNDKIYGKGKYTVANGAVYEGNFQNGQFYGQGKMSYASGNVYEGNFQNGQFYGQGKMSYASGNMYEGEWKDGKSHGQGKMSYASGAVSEGEWKDGKEHGQGKYTRASNAYEGEWKDGKMHGQGKFTLADGSVYEGEWKDGKHHGQGKFTYAKQSMRVLYEGEWKDGKEHGQGKLTYFDGDKYEGELINGKRHGQGKFTFANGGVYEGGFQDDKRHGEGKETYPDGGVIEVEYKKGERVNNKPSVLLEIAYLGTIGAALIAQLSI